MSTPLTPLQVLLTGPTAASVRTTAVQMLVSLGVPASSWRNGGGWSSLLTTTTAMFSSVIGQILSLYLSAQFLPTCPPAFLPFLALYLYGVVVNAATYATGVVSLTNPGGGTYNVAAGQLVVANSFTGQTYLNTAPFTLGPLTTLANIPVQATVSGSVGNASAGPGVGSVDTVVSTQLFAGASVTVTNPAPVLGLDADAPAVVQAKCLAAKAVRSYLGPEGAFEFAVKTAINAQGQPVNINRSAVSSDPSTGFVTCYCASPAGLPTQADLDAVNALCVALAQAQGVTGGNAGGFAASCTVVPLSSGPQTWTIWASGAGGTTTPDQIQAAASLALATALSGYRIGGIAEPPSTQGYVYAGWIKTQLMASNPLIYDVKGLSGDIPLSPGQVAALTSNTTIAVRQTA